MDPVVNAARAHLGIGVDVREGERMGREVGGAGGTLLVAGEVGGGEEGGTRGGGGGAVGVGVGPGVNAVRASQQDALSRKMRGLKRKR